MAQSTGAISRADTQARAGLLLAAILLAGGMAAIAALGFAGGGGDGGGITTQATMRRIIGIIRSASVQAGLSALASALIALPVAVALHRLKHHARFYQAARLFCGMAFIIPTTVAATGLLEIWGRNGFFANACRAITAATCEGFTVYGLHGVVLGHVFLNAPMLILIFLPLLEAIPARQYALARHLGMGRRARMRLIEWPAMRPALIGACGLVFLLCFSSFALVLMLGGGPRVTTLEVEIYAAIRFDFDFRLGAILSLVQFACAAILVAAIARTAPMRMTALDSGAARGGMRFGDSRIHDCLMLAVFALTVILPLAAVVSAGIGTHIIAAISRPRFMPTLLTSLLIAMTAAMLATGAGLILAHARMRLAGRWRHIVIDGGVMLYLVLPAIVLGSAAFIVLGARGDAFGHAFGVVVLANALLALPFAVRILMGSMRRLYPVHDPLAASMGIAGITRWRILTLPAMAREVGIVAGLAAAMSLGDLGVIALFAGNDMQTLPWMLYQMAGRYQLEQAKGLALILLLLAVGLLLAGRYAAPILFARSCDSEAIAERGSRAKIKEKIRESLLCLK